MFSPGSPRIVLQKRKADLPPKNVSAYEAPDPIVSKIINPSFIEGTDLLKGNEENCFHNVVGQ